MTNPYSINFSVDMYYRVGICCPSGSRNGYMPRVKYNCMLWARRIYMFNRSPFINTVPRRVIMKELLTGCS